MEEEEERKKEFEKNSRKDSDNHEVGGDVQENIDPSHQENIKNTDGVVADVGHDSVTLQAVDSATTVVDEDQFEQVSLKDQDKIVGATQGGHVDPNQSSIQIYPEFRYHQTIIWSV
ncbi:hypothetical protein Pyn_04719 [Prunus yedoensis var. nudiflora]|uniref:Uncharacterized protein n=1 Tax=Prunus yedoensis var. nudiflora TaxID=2094558 RepID=A0A314UZI8_PRUYE|nr:hypothetical protein Pyn_04719 [Prunus yedoensis var. nudiflora]